MPRLTKEQWDNCRLERESTGASFGDLADKYNVSKSAIVRRSKKEGWLTNENIQARLKKLSDHKLTERVTGDVTAGDPLKVLQLQDEYADRMADVRIRHQVEWKEFRRLFPVANEDMTEAPRLVDIRRAQAASIVLCKSQDGERRAWGIPDFEPLTIPLGNLESMTLEELEALAKRG